MKKILIIMASYWPGFKECGVLQSVRNLVDVFGDKAAFNVLTHNHDLFSEEIYTNVKSDTWNEIGKAKVFYSSHNCFSVNFLRKMTSGYDAIFLCGPYWLHSQKIVLLKKLCLIQPTVYLASMGTFSPGSLKLNRLKKYLFWKVFNFLKLGKGITWSFTSEKELSEAKDVLSEDNCSTYILANDLPRKYEDYQYLRGSSTKKSGELKIVFLSRISPGKNLTYALDLIKKLDGKITFDIYGNISDSNYWEECKRKIRNLPKNVTCIYKGSILPDMAIQVFSSYDAFLFPTLGENFGHVIYEALLSGCIPLISNNTPWDNLEEAGCGYVTCLEDNNGYANKINKLLLLDDVGISRIRKNAYLYAKDFYQDISANSGYVKLL